ncbi:hypothetical protein Q8F55_007587 [Vanrija albida]|uniref:Uncharacterized protein n=1 Tax=Vanrija albida TaxID=181172 RepID=A0ABR3PUV0_9TREE
MLAAAAVAVPWLFAAGALAAPLTPDTPHRLSKRDTQVFGQPVWVLVLIVVGAVVLLSVLGLIIKRCTGRNPFQSHGGAPQAYSANHNYYDNSAQHHHHQMQQHEWDRQQRANNEWHEQNYGYQAQQNQHHY